MTHIDNSKIFHEGVYADATVYVPANTTYYTGTVLGRLANGKLSAFSTLNNTDTSAELDNTDITVTEGFKTSPLYILAQDVVNSTGTAAEYDLVRVFDSGVVDKAGLIFINEDDATDVTVLDELKANNFRLVNVEEQAGTSSLGR